MKKNILFGILTVICIGNLNADAPKNLESAIYIKDINAVQQFLNNGADPNARSGLSTPLIVAIRSGSVANYYNLDKNYKIVKLLIDSGADVNNGWYIDEAIAPIDYAVDCLINAYQWFDTIKEPAIPAINYFKSVIELLQKNGAVSLRDEKTLKRLYSGSPDVLKDIDSRKILRTEFLNPKPQKIVTEKEKLSPTDLQHNLSMLAHDLKILATVAK